MSSPEEQYSIDHEAIRAIGESMTQHIGSLLAQPEDRHAAIASLNECAENVPYETLFEEDTRLAVAIEAIDSKRQTITATMKTELGRLSKLGATFAQKRPSQLAQAKALIATKRTAAERAAAKQLESFDGPRTRLAHEHQQLADTIDAVATAWPVAPYSEAVLEIVAEKYSAREDLDGVDQIDDETEPLAGTPPPQPPKRQVAVEQIPGPYAELANKIPNLTDRLEGPTSAHVHIYEKIETAQAVLDRAVAKPETERSEEEDNLCRAVFVLRRRFLMNADDLSFLEVYEAQDIFELTKRLNRFSRKNRPDFNQLEGQILDKAAAAIPLLDRGVSQDIRGAQERMERDEPGRTGMTWHSLAKHANRACDTMRARFFAGGAKNTHLKNYVIEVGDHSPKKPDLSWVYQFVADDFAFDVLASRRSDQQVSAQERFMKNSGVIAAWLEEARDLLSELPEEFRLTRPLSARPGYRFQNAQAIYENVTARTGIMNVIHDLEIRREGTSNGRVARLKPMTLDPLGALNHQLRLGHMIDQLKSELIGYDAPGEGYTEEITPFE